jgi:hypothetical protein
LAAWAREAHVLDVPGRVKALGVDMDDSLSKSMPFVQLSPLQTGTIRQRPADDKFLQATDETATVGTESVEVGGVRALGVVYALCDGGFEQLTLIHTPERDASQNLTLSKKRRPRFLSKREVRGKRSAARKLAADRAEIESQQKIMNDIIFRNEPGILCLPCCAVAYEEEMVIGFDKTMAARGFLVVPPSHKERRRRLAARGFLAVPPSQQKRTS